MSVAKQPDCITIIAKICEHRAFEAIPVNATKTIVGRECNRMVYISKSACHDLDRSHYAAAVWTFPALNALRHNQPLTRKPFLMARAIR